MRLILLIAVGSLLCSYAQGEVNVPTQRGDNQRSGVNLEETQLDHQSLRTRFAKLWTLYSDAKVMAQPLYVSNMKSERCPLGCNTVIFGSMKGTVYAYLADQRPTTVNDTLVWAKYLGPPRQGGHDIDWWATDDPWWGIVGTPALDLTNNLLYVVVWNEDQEYRLWALDLKNGQPKMGPVVVQGSINGVMFRNPSQVQQRKQRAGLLLDRGALFVAFGGDNPDALAGWLFIYDADTLAFKTVWSPTGGGKNGGIWMSGNGPVADSVGHVYLQSGDGEFKRPAAGPGGNVNMDSGRFGNSLLEIRLSTAGGSSKVKVLDFFTPCNQAFLNRNDMDLGSAGPLLLPGNLIIGSGKQGILYLMDRDRMGRFKPGAPTSPPPELGCSESDRVLQRIRATSGHIHGTPIFWKGPNGMAWVYVMGEGDGLKAFPVGNGRLKAAPADVKQSIYRPPHPASVTCGGGPPHHWMPGGILAVSSKADQPGTGIVWALVPANGDANSYRGVKGLLMAFNAENIEEELWRSQGADPTVDTQDSFGLLARFVPPTVANGKVFIATAGDRELLQRYDGPGGDCAARPHQFPDTYGVAVYGLR